MPAWVLRLPFVANGTRRPSQETDTIETRHSAEECKRPTSSSSETKPGNSSSLGGAAALDCLLPFVCSVGREPVVCFADAGAGLALPFANVKLKELLPPTDDEASTALAAFAVAGSDTAGADPTKHGVMPCLEALGGQAVTITDNKVEGHGTVDIDLEARNTALEQQISHLRALLQPWLCPSLQGALQRRYHRILGSDLVDLHSPHHCPCSQHQTPHCHARTLKTLHALALEAHRCLLGCSQ